MDQIKAKQQVVEKIQESAKILVTVSDNPSVDALSAALALTLLFDKQEKYATAIFSGETPPAIAFLEPEKTFDDTTDSLRDFIIALNKEKADHLRYKVEGDAVKIFITPYKTTIDESDLEFSQGDYNVELVIALGVDTQEHLDKALESHGQILHDAAIVTITSGEQASDLGGIDWHDAGASSLSEMIAGLAEALKEDKKKSLVDAPIATALLTGIVAETDRFSNEHTTSRAMTISAALMSAGADQQLIANELQASREIEAKPVEDESDDDNDVEVDKDSDDGSMTIKQHDPSSLAIDHEGETLADLDRRVLGENKAKKKVIEEVEAIQEEEVAEEEATDTPVDEPIEEPAPTEPEVLRVEQEPEAEPEPVIHSAYEPEFEELPTPITPPAPAPVPTEEPTIASAYSVPDANDEPTFSGTLNATTEQAAEDSRREAESDQNKTILSHAYLGGSEGPETAPGSAQIGFPGTPPAAPGSVGVNDVPADSGEPVHSAYAPEGGQAAPSQAAVAFGGERVIQPLPAPEATPADLGLPLPPPIPSFGIPGAPTFPLPPAQQPAILGDILAPEAPAPIDYTSNAVAAANTAYAPEEPVLPPLAPAPEVQAQANPSDPGQFQIPTQH